MNIYKNKPQTRGAYSYNREVVFNDHPPLYYILLYIFFSAYMPVFAQLTKKANYYILTWATQLIYISQFSCHKFTHRAIYSCIGARRVYHTGCCCTLSLCKVLPLNSSLLIRAVHKRKGEILFCFSRIVVRMRFFNNTLKNSAI